MAFLSDAQLLHGSALIVLRMKSFATDSNPKRHRFITGRNAEAAVTAQHVAFSSAWAKILKSTPKCRCTLQTETKNKFGAALETDEFLY
mmetsp:Transcript_11904/g.16484  ORF Transcript_11904/g.16484 Transcript_11904/m.16484 type:complete len:89 (+) Transcript_11904:689-955(+)